MSLATLDRADPAVRAALNVNHFERRQRTGRVLGAVTLVMLAAVGPIVAAPVVGDQGATYAAVLASALFIGSAAALWPWAWTAAERCHHELAAIWAQARADANETTPWDRYAAWADANGEHVELVLITKTGSAAAEPAPSPFSRRRIKQVDAEAIVEATAAMDALRDEAGEFEAEARERYLDAEAAADRKPYEDALREVDESAAAEQRQAEAKMLRELAEQEAAERRAQASAVARALRRP